MRKEGSLGLIPVEIFAGVMGFPEMPFFGFSLTDIVLFSTFASIAIIPIKPNDVFPFDH